MGITTNEGGFLQISVSGLTASSSDNTCVLSPSISHILSHIETLPASLPFSQLPFSAIFLRSVELGMNSFHFLGKSATTARRRNGVHPPTPDMCKYHGATHPHKGGRLWCSPLVPRRKAAVVAHLVCSVHEVHWDAEGE